MLWLLGLCANAESPQVLPEIQFRPRFEFDTGRDGVSGGDVAFVTHRARLGSSVVWPKFGVRVVMQDARAWGEELDTRRDFSGDGIDLAFGTFFWRPTDDVELVVGREEVSVQDERLIARANWRQPGRHFDGGRFKWTPEGWVFEAAGYIAFDGDLFAFDTQDQVTQDGGDQTMWFVRGGRETKTLQLQGLVTVDDRREVQDNESLRLTPGLFVKGRSGIFEGRLEGYGQFGSAAGGDASVAAWLVGARGVLAPEWAGSPTFTLGVDAMSGDRDLTDDRATTFNTLRGANHKYYGPIDIASFFRGLTIDDQGLVDGYLALGASPHERAGVSLTQHVFTPEAGRDTPWTAFETDLALTVRAHDALTVKSGVSTWVELADPEVLPFESFAYLQLDVRWAKGLTPFDETVAMVPVEPPVPAEPPAPPEPELPAAFVVTGDGPQTLPSGTTYRAAEGWTVTPRTDGATLTGPEGELALELIEVRGAASLADAIDQALAARVPDFDREKRPSEDRPGDDGWDASRAIGYIVAPEEERQIITGCLQKDDLFVCMHADNAAAPTQRRGSEMWLVQSSARPPGHVEETYADRTPRTIDDAFVDEIRTSMKTLMEQADITGAALTLFDADTVYMEEGFGVKKLGEDDPVTADTRFLIASNTKPLTTLLLAKLVDDGTITYDTKVTDIDPDFRLGDPETTAKVEVKHLICACTGMPRQDFEWLFQWDGVTAEETYANLGAMQPTTTFGELYQYSNPLAAGAGFIAGHAVHPDKEVGEAYDAAMQRLVFDPLGMTHSTFDYDAVQKTDMAWPHSWSTKMENVPGEFDLNRSIWPLRPAGALWSTVGDYRRYLQMELREGALEDGSTYIGKDALLARRAPQIQVADGAYYGMGLGISEQKGITRYNHGGSMIGYKSQFVIDPKSGIGAVVFTNSNTGSRASAILDHILETLYADDSPEALEGIEAAMAGQRKGWGAEVARWTEPPAPAAVERLAASYTSKGLGGLVVRRDGDAVIFEFDSWSSPMATREEPDGSVSFLTTLPGLDGFDLNAPAEGPIDTLTLRDMQHTYTFERVE